MSNTTNTDTKIQRNASKGATVRKMGFESGIHALPVDIKNQIDQMIKQKYPPTKILRHLAQKYPNQSLPSKTAVYSYRRKHYTESLASHRQLLQSDNQLDVDKIKLKSVLLAQIKRFVAFDLPTFRERWIKAKENDELLLLPQTKDIGKMYMEAMRLCIEAVPKLNIEIIDEAELETNHKTTSELEAESRDLDAKLARIMAKRIVQYSIRSITETQIGNQSTAT